MNLYIYLYTLIYIHTKEKKRHHTEQRKYLNSPHPNKHFNQYQWHTSVSAELPFTKYSISVLIMETKCFKQLKLTPSNFQQNMSVLSILKYNLVFRKLICGQHRSTINSASQYAKNSPKNGDIFKFLVYHFLLTPLSEYNLIQRRGDI